MMEFELPKLERLPLKEINSKDVNQLFKYVAEIGFGTYGRVYKAFSRSDSAIYALKKLIIYKEKEGQKGKEYEKEGFPITALREIKFLQNLDHQNIIKLHQVVISSSIENVKSRSCSTYLVFEFMDHDFLGLLNAKVTFTLPQIKCIMKQILKGANILYNNQGEVKIADFGLARIHNMERKYTNEVVTLWYRAPELLLGSQNYDTQIDMWSVGCFFGELMSGEVMFRGDKNSRQLELIYEKCGSPDELIWPGVKSYNFYDDLGPKRYFPRTIIPYMKNKIKNADENAMDLLDKLLLLCPNNRINSQNALNHKFFTSEPLACEISQMPIIDKNELHGPVYQPYNNKTIMNNAKEDISHFDNVKKKVKID